MAAEEGRSFLDALNIFVYELKREGETYADLYKRAQKVQEFLLKFLTESNRADNEKILVVGHFLIFWGLLSEGVKEGKNEFVNSMKPVNCQCLPVYLQAETGKLFHTDSFKHRNGQVDEPKVEGAEKKEESDEEHPV